MGYKLASNQLSIRIKDQYFNLKTIIDPLFEHKQGLQHTALGYGSKIPTKYKVYNPSKRIFQRVYSMIYSNSGSLYTLDSNNNETFLMGAL